jgi:hypothetical protein
MNQTLLYDTAAHPLMNQTLLYDTAAHPLMPIISSAYGINLESRILDKIFYVVGKSDMPL